MADEKLSVEITAIDRAGEVFKNLSRGSDDLMRSLTSILTPTRLIGSVVGVELVQGVKAAVENFSKLALEVRDLAYISGGSARDVSILVTGLGDLGVEVGTVQQGMALMSRAVEAGSPALNRLGVSVRDNSGQMKSGLTLFYQTVDALGSMKNEVERNSLAREIFGRGWTQMLPVLAAGSNAIRTLGEENARLGKVMDEEGIAKARALRMALNDLKNIGEGLGLSLANAVIGPLAAVGKAFAEAARRASEYRHVAEQMRKAGVTDPQAVRNIVEASGAYSDMGAWRRGKPGAEGGPALPREPESPAEMARRLSGRAQEMHLEASALRALAVSEEDRLEAAVKTVNASRQKSLDELALQVKKGERTEAEVSSVRVGINREADAQIEKFRRESLERQQKQAVDIAKATSELELRETSSYTQLSAEQVAEIKENARREEAGKLLQARIDSITSAREISDATEQAEQHLTVVRETNEGERRKEAAETHVTLKRLYDDDVTEAVHAELAKTHLYRDESKKRIDVELGVYDALEAERRRDEARERALQLKKYNETENYFDRVRLALQINTRTYETENERMLQITKDFAHAATRSLDDLYFNVLTGKFDSFGDFLKNFWASMARVASQNMAEATMTGLFGGGGSGGGGGFSLGNLGGLAGGAVGLGKDVINWFSSGGAAEVPTYFDQYDWWLDAYQTGTPYVPRTGLAQLHEGEMVLSPTVAAMLRAQLAAGGRGQMNMGWGSSGLPAGVGSLWMPSATTGGGMPSAAAGGGGPDWGLIQGLGGRGLQLAKILSQGIAAARAPEIGTTLAANPELAHAWAQSGMMPGTVSSAGAGLSVLGLLASIYSMATAKDPAMAAPGVFTGAITAASMAASAGMLGTSAAAAGLAAASSSLGWIAVPGILFAIMTTINASKRKAIAKDRRSVDESIMAIFQSSEPAKVAEFLEASQLWPDTAKDTSYFHRASRLLWDNIVGGSPLEAALSNTWVGSGYTKPWHPNLAEAAQGVIPILRGGRWPNALELAMAGMEHPIAVAPSDMQKTWDPMRETGGGNGGDGAGFSDGGYIGAPTRVKAHVGEVILNPREQAVVKQLTGGGRGAPVIHLTINVENKGVLGEHLPDSITRTISSSLERLWHRQIRVRTGRPVHD